MKNIKLVAAFIIFLLLAIFFQYQYDSNINYFSEKDTFITLPSGKTIKILSFGYKEIIGDLLYIWAIQLYSIPYLENRFDYIEQIFNTITDILPRYFEIYLVGSMIMTLEAKEPMMAIRFLEKASKNFPEEYIFLYEAGFIAYDKLKDPTLAKSLFIKAKDRTKTPDFIKRKIAHMTYEENKPEQAYKEWLELYQKALSQHEKFAAFIHLYTIKAELDMKKLETAIKQFKEKYKRFPVSLDELLSRGFIWVIPQDFNGKDYIYNKSNGKIQAKRINKWGKFL